MVGALMTLAGGGRAAAAAGVDTPAMPRVRSHHPGIASLGKPSVADVTSRYFSYQRIGRLGTYTAFETEAAVQAGHAVRAEVSKYRAGGH